MLKKLHQLGEQGAILIVSLPHVKKRITSKLNNSLRRGVTQHFSYFLNKEEHPYPIPGKKKMARLITGLFMLNKYIESGKTDYFVLSRI